MLFRSMWLVMRDVELTNAEGEVDRVEIFERRRDVRQVQREKGDRDQDYDRGARRTRRETMFSAGTAISAVHVRAQAGRRNSPSLRLPVR